MWKVYGLGQRGAAKELIYTQWRIVEELPNKGECFYGLDFGFNHPAAFVKVEYYEGAHYVQELVYQSGLTLSELLRLIQSFGIGKGTIYADAAEPKSIEEMYRAGLNIKAANKDVWAGILKVKSFPLFVTQNSINLQRELQSYKWKKDKEDNIIDEPVKANDDGLDALRYAIYNYHDKPKFHFIPRSEW
jgi:phage terminase large subunit